MSLSEGHGHGHGHGQDGNSMAHDHSNDLPSNSPSIAKQSLYSKIDIAHITGLNINGGEEAAKRIIKPYEHCEEETRYCESDLDDSMILFIPFTAQVKLQSITIKAGPAGFTPARCLVYTNSPGLDFSSVQDQKPVEEISLVPQREGVEYAVRPSKFHSVRSLHLFFPENVSAGQDEEQSRLFYVGLKGTYTEFTRQPDSVIVYEAQANPSDHKITDTDLAMGSHLGI